MQRNVLTAAEEATRKICGICPRCKNKGSYKNVEVFEKGRLFVGFTECPCLSKMNMVKFSATISPMEWPEET